MKKVKFIAACLLLAFVSSCNQDETLLKSNGGNDDAKQINNGTLTEKITPIGGKTIYEVDPKIMAYFQHFYQMTTDALPKGQHACGPTSYMMGAYCLAGYKDRPYKTQYPLSAKKEIEIYDAIKIINNYSAIKLPHLTTYGNNTKNDGNWIKCENKNTIDRSIMKTFIQNALINNKFVIVGINAYDYDAKYPDNPSLYNNDVKNYDLSPSGETSGNKASNWNYITRLDESPEKSSNKLVGGHIIIIVKLTVNLDGTGVIEYVDPLAKPHSPSNRKYVSYTRLLESMAMNGTANKSYDAISIGLK